MPLINVSSVRVINRLVPQSAADWAAVPAGRFGEPAEFGQLCAFLCSTHAGYITGQNLKVDGGLTRSV